MTTEIERRVAFTNATKEKYIDRPFKWGSVDCMKMLRFHLMKAGHKVPKVKPYRSAQSAKASLRELGFDDVTSLIAEHLPEIAPASAFVGDIATMQGDAGFDGVVINCGVKWMGFHEDADGLVMIIPKDIKKAFRV